MGSGALFGSAEAALGYASARPPVHPAVVALAEERFDLPASVEVALDVGCGAGLSTRPLVGRARRCLAVDPEPEMVALVSQVAPGALGAEARAEALPVPDGSVGLVTAAGSLDFVDDLGAAVAELARVLAPGGMALVYDFATGRRLRDGPDLDAWFDEVLARWPRRPPCTSPVTAESLAAGGMVVVRQPFEVDVSLTRSAYVDYLLTESFVTLAVGRGEDRADIARWLASTVPWPGVDPAPADVVFAGYVLAARHP
ncbi:MAG: class I SAM-dependent methyltransferase [Acidimicrobiales bacterium]